MDNVLKKTNIRSFERRIG